jgi:splicing suppressor protein 51
LQYCSRCKAPTILYCSRKCQVEDYDEHKKTCILNNKIFAFTGPTDDYVPRKQPEQDNQPDLLSRNKALEVTITKPFHYIRAGKWLRKRPEKDVFKLLIDVYRLRMDQTFIYGGIADNDGLYGRGVDGRAGLRRFLGLLQSKRALLPKWWSPSSPTECVAFGSNIERFGFLSWSNLAVTICAEDVVEHYGDPSMPNQLRLFGEQVYGSNPVGTFDGNALLAIHLRAEKAAEKK